VRNAEGAVGRLRRAVEERLVGRERGGKGQWAEG
jgi:molybdenum-dependent DNA-binding transcriptional regulator ModE